MNETLWQDFRTDDHDTYTYRTDDPRVVAVAIRDVHDAQPPDGEMFAPAYYFDRGGVTRAGNGYHDAESDTIAGAYDTASSYWANWHYGRKVGRRFDADAMVARYLRVFYGVHEVAEVSSGVHRGDDVVIFGTPTHREHAGIRDDATDMLRGDVAEWQAYLDGDVYGVGTLVNPEHVGWGEDEDTPTYEDGDWEWADGPFWGYYGDDYAAESALEMAEWAKDRLPELLPF